jgi:hypothetical protein
MTLYGFEKHVIQNIIQHMVEDVEHLKKILMKKKSQHHFRR